MILSLTWLRDYLQKAEVKIDPKELAEKLTMRGLQVASIKRPTQPLENVLVGRIEKISKHPNADRLQVTQITFTEDAKELRQVVCGAKNIAEGDIVPVAIPGAVLPGNLEIKVSSIRGVESLGMICSGKELGVAESGEGILQLPKHAALGQPVFRLLGGQAPSSDDALLELELTPNRPDCLSVMGLAREIAPLLRTNLRDPKPARFRITPHRTSSIIRVDVDDPKQCSRYVARVVDSLKVTDSPDWIKQRLEAVGMRPVNNIVDITNFVMMEYGQPLHAFDLRKIQSGSIRVGSIKSPTDFTLLSGETVQILPGDILILDGDRPIALAGIMGGANSQIEPDTTSIVLESANFDPIQIRRTAKRLGLVSESSKRFEKGVDPVSVILASDRAASLLRDSFNANVYHPPIDTNESTYKEPAMAIDLRDVRKVIGLNLSSDTVSDVLESIGFSSHKKSTNVLVVRIPSFRLDIKESIDIIEEVARLVGYDSIQENYPLSLSTYDRTDEGSYEFEQRVKEILSRSGLLETIHYSFTSEELLKKFGVYHSDAVVIKNPISDEMKVMRTSLLPSLLQTYVYNHNRKATNQRIFELAKTYQKDASEETKVKETLHVSALLSGEAVASGWRATKTPVDFFFVKGLLELTVRQLTSVYVGFEALRNHRLFHPSRSAILKLGVREIGYIGEIHPFIREHVLDTDEPVVVFELNLDALRKYERTTIRYKAPSKFPSVELDLAFTIDRTISSYSLLETIRTSGGVLLNDASVFDVYEGEHIPEGKRSVGFRLNFLSNERTLLDGEVNSLKDRIISSLSEKHGAQLRG